MLVVGGIAGVYIGGTVAGEQRGEGLVNEGSVGNSGPKSSGMFQQRRVHRRAQPCASHAIIMPCAVQQDLTAQREGLLGLGVDPLRVYVDHGLTGDTLVVTKLDRLARSLPDARAIADELTAQQVRLSLGGSVYDPNNAVGRLLFNVLAMVAEIESDLIRLCTREGMKIAKAKGRLRGKQPKLNAPQKRT